MPSPQPRLRVLVVDDDHDVLELYRTLLQGAPVAMRQTHNPAAALRLIAEERFDVIFTDLKMPTLAGSDIVRLVRGSAANRNARLAVVSGYFDAENTAELQALGVDHVLPKPFKRQDMLAILAAADVRSEGAERTPSSYGPDVLQIVRDATETVVGRSLPLLRFGPAEERASSVARGDVASVVALFGERGWGELHLVGDLTFFRTIYGNLVGDQKATPTIDQVSDLANEMCNQVAAEVVRGLMRREAGLILHLGLPVASGALAAVPRLTTGRLASTFVTSRTVPGAHAWIEFALCGSLAA